MYYWMCGEECWGAACPHFSACLLKGRDKMIEEIKKETTKKRNKFFSVDGTLLDLGSITAVGAVKRKTALFGKGYAYFSVIFKSGKEISFYSPDVSDTSIVNKRLIEELIGLGEYNE